MDILISPAGIKIFFRYAFLAKLLQKWFCGQGSGPDPVSSLTTASWIWLGRINQLTVQRLTVGTLVRPHSSQQERNGKEKTGSKPMATAALFQPLNLGWRHFWTVMPHEAMLTLCLCIYLNAAKIPLQRISPVEGGPPVILCRGRADFEVTPLTCKPFYSKKLLAFNLFHVFTLFPAVLDINCFILVKRWLGYFKYDCYK